ncbi:hypothetical protein CPC16_002775 [Podila verticillata]|nr:hypothetical protein CPC16_002775 [Podila verticillata]
MLPYEILHMIFSYLRSTHLTVCACVNKEFCKTVSPLLWKTINITENYKLKQLLTAERRQGLVKNAECIRELHLIHEDMFNLFVPRPHESSTDAALDPTNTSFSQPFVMCTNLLRLVVSVYQERHTTYDPGYFWIYNQPSSTPHMEAGIMTLVEQNPRLESIEMLNETCPTVVLAIAHRDTPFLHELEFATNMSRQSLKYLLDYLPQQITKLSLTGIHGEGPPLGNKAVKANHAPIQHAVLRYLQLYGELDGLEEDILLPFLNTCSCLTTFKVSDIGCFSVKNICEKLAQLGAYLKRLNGKQLFPDSKVYANEGGEMALESNTAEIIAMNSRLKVIDFTYCPLIIGRLTAAAILRSAEYLQCIILPCHSRISAKDVHVLLSHCKSLEVFRFYKCSYLCGSLVVTLSASEFLSVEWASLSLWHFGCAFRVPRPDDHVPANHQDCSWNSPTIEQSHKIQRQVYRHIAQQTNLVNMDLGTLVNCQDPERLWYSLEMTLESGLDELACLKKLKNLTLHNMNHRIGTKELDWMVKNWPHLSHIHGFYEEDEDLPKDIERWLRTKKIHRNFITAG